MIRAATHDDEPACLEMARAFHVEANLAEVPFDDESALATGRHLIDSQDGALLVAESGGTLVGMAGALAFPHYANFSVRIAQEVFWWVHPDARNGITAMRLKRALEAWARGAGCKVLIMIALPIDSPAESIYLREGFRPCERSFIKRL